MSNCTFLNGGANLVLHDLDPRLVADDLVALLDGADSPDIKAHRGVELQGVATRRGLRAAEHDPDLHSDLVDEDDQGVGPLDVAGELAQRLRHEPRVEPDVGVAHLALDLGLGGERGHRVDDHHVDGPGAHQGVGDLEGLLAGIRLRDEKVVDVEPDLLPRRPGRGRAPHRRTRPSRPGAGLRDHFERQGRLAGRLRPVDLDHPPAREPADSERRIETERPGRNGLDVAGHRRVAEAHDGSASKLPVELTERGIERGFPAGPVRSFLNCHCASFRNSWDSRVRRRGPEIIPQRGRSPRDRGGPERRRAGARPPRRRGLRRCTRDGG